MTIEGMDVSSANPVADWAKVPDEILFQYIRATYGNRVDGSLQKHWDAALNAARLCGAYTFSEPDDDPLEEVKKFIDTNAVHMVLPPALDVEVLGGRSAVDVLKYTRAFLNELEKRLGRTPVIYTGPGFWNSLGPEAKTPDWARYPLWIAHYGVSKPVVPAPWKDWTFWQYAANTIVLSKGLHLYGWAAQRALREDPKARVIATPGLIPGVTGEVDRNKFNGTFEDLKRLAGLIPSAK